MHPDVEWVRKPIRWPLSTHLTVETIEDRDPSNDSRGCCQWHEAHPSLWRLDHDSGDEKFLREDAKHLIQNWCSHLHTGLFDCCLTHQTYVHTHTCVCMCLYVCVYVYMHTYLCLHVPVCVCVSVCAHMSVHFTHIRVWLQHRSFLSPQRMYCSL